MHVLPCLLISCATHEGAFRSFGSLEQERIHMRSSTKTRMIQSRSLSRYFKRAGFWILRACVVCASPVGNVWKCKIRGTRMDIPFGGEKCII